MTPASQTVNAGSSVSYSVTTAVTAGTAQTINPSVSGLPAGVTGSFSPASVTAGGSSTLTLTAASGAASATATATATATFTVTGSGTSPTHTASAQVMVAGTTTCIIITNQAITAFNGHTAAGTWQLKVQDLAVADVGTLNSWSLTIVGNCNTAGNCSGSATPNIATVDNCTVCTNLTVSTTGGDSSLAKLDISGRHDFCSVLSGTLAHNGTTVAAFPTGTFPAAACNFSFTNRAVPGLSGDASGTWTFCITDTDAFGDTGTLNSWAVHN